MKIIKNNTKVQLKFKDLVAGDLFYYTEAGAVKDVLMKLLNKPTAETPENSVSLESGKLYIISSDGKVLILQGELKIYDGRE